MMRSQSKSSGQKGARCKEDYRDFEKERRDEEKRFQVIRSDVSDDIDAA
jgi:hypothetical protein